MNVEEIRRHRNAKPFTPFDLVMNDGKAVFVAVGERMAISPGGRVVYVYEKDGLKAVDVSQVTELRPRGQMATGVETNS